MKALHEAKTGNHQGLIMDSNGRNVAVVYEKEDTPAIVTACNCHEELLEALKGLLYTLDEQLTEDAQENEDIIEAQNNARAAIQKAEAL
jgi:K+/H+ antiporter YhaU regulatory subunit KhtT